MAAEFVVVGYEEIHERMVGEARRHLEEKRGRLAEAYEEADKLESYLRRQGWETSRLRLESEGAPPVIRVPLNGTVVYVIVYPPRWHLLIRDFYSTLSELLERAEGEGKYVVLVFYTRRGKLSLAAYLHLGFVIETWGVGILFVNGGPEEVHEVLDTLKREGKYTPGEEDSVELDSI